MPDNAAAAVAARPTRPVSKKTGAVPAKAGTAVAQSDQKVAPAKIVKPAAKLVRDSFTMPQADYALIATLKQRALDAKRAAKKSELLRAGLHALATMKAPDLLEALSQLTPLKTGRPKKAA